jgi:hypothetical protein
LIAMRATFPQRRAGYTAGTTNGTAPRCEHAAARLIQPVKPAFCHASCAADGVMLLLRSSVSSYRQVD